MDVSTHYAAFKNVTDGTVALSGTVGYADYENTNETQDRVFVRGVITVSGGDKEFELRHFTGVPAGWDYCLGMGNHTTIPPGPDGAFWIASEVYVERLN